MQGIEGKRALVTGASTGIGQAIAIRLGREGAHVAINYLNQEEKAEQTEARVRGYQQAAAHVRNSGRQVCLLQADVSNANDVAHMVRTAIDELDGLDILVNNAGIQVDDASDAMDVDEFDRVISVNLRGAWLCAREAIRYWLDEGRSGIIINVSSVHQEIPKPRFVSYSASKGGLRNLTRTLALEYAGRGIRVNAIGPGATITPINRSWVEDPEKKQMVESHIPMGRAGKAEEMASAVAFLASDEASYITGQTLFIDGGLTLYPDFRTAWSSE